MDQNTENREIAHFPPIGPIRFISLRTKFVVFFSLIIILTCSALSAYFIQNKRTAMVERLRDLGSILVKNLAHNVRYGVIIEERIILDQFIRGVMEVEEVVYVIISGTDGQVLAAGSKGKLEGVSGVVRSAERPLYPRPEIAETVAKQPRPDPLISHLRITGTGSVPIPFDEISFASVPAQESFYDFALSVSRRSESQLESFALQAEELQTTQKEGAPSKVYGVVQLGLSEVPLQHELRRILRNFLLLTLVIIIAGIVSTGLLARKVITPLRNLAVGARKVGEGDLTTVVLPTTRDEVGQLTSLFNLMTKSIQERNQAISSNLEIIRRQVTQLTTLNQTSAAITSTLDQDRLLSNVLQLLMDNLGFARMVMFLWDSDRGVASVGQVAGVPPEIEQAARRLEVPVQDDGGLAAEMLILGKPVLVLDLEAMAHRISPAVLPLVRQIGLRSFVGVPLRSQQRILGYLGADRGTQPCTQEDLDLLMTVASHVAVAIDNARAYSESEQLTEAWKRESPNGRRNSRARMNVCKTMIAGAPSSYRSRPTNCARP